jgi:hypothetical protein
LDEWLLRKRFQPKSLPRKKLILRLIHCIQGFLSQFCQVDGLAIMPKKNEASLAQGKTRQSNFFKDLT